MALSGTRKANGPGSGPSGPLLAAESDFPDRLSRPALKDFQDITPDVREMVRKRVTSMDHVEVIVRLRGRPDAGMTETQLREATRLDATQLARAVQDLVRGEIISFDDASRTYRYAPRSEEDRAAIESLVQLYHQRPVTLVKLIYSMPSIAIDSFADAFRLREDKK